MRKTPKELLEEVMAKVKKKEEMELEFQERIRQIEEKKSRGKKQRVVVNEPTIIGYLGKEEPKRIKNFYGIVTPIEEKEPEYPKDELEGDSDEVDDELEGKF